MRRPWPLKVVRESGIFPSSMLKRFALLVGVTLALCLFGCGGGGSGTSDTDFRIFFLNASPDAGAVDFKMNDEIAENDIPYKGTSSLFLTYEFLEDDTDGYDISIHDGTSDLELVRQAKKFGQDTENIGIAYGIRNFVAGDDLKRFRLALFTVNRTAVNGNRARLVVFHGIERAPGSATPKVIFKNPGSNPQFQTPAIDVGGTAVIEVDSGSQSWEVKRADTDGIFATTTFNLEAGAVYIVVLSGIENDPIVGNQPSINFVKLETTS